MGDDQLYCEHCGHEIMLVAEYDPALDVGPEEKPEEPGKKRTLKDRLLDPHPAALVLLGLLIVVIILAFFFNQYNRRINSREFQLEEAGRKEQEGDYNAAIEHLDRALALSPQDKDIPFLKIEDYLAMGNEAAARSMLEAMAFQEEDQELAGRAYERLVRLFVDHQDYEGAAALLKDAPEAVAALFPEYLAPDPVFSTPGGSYDTELALKLSDDGIGNIYYTMDGSDPTMLSSEYFTPIFLGSGDYEIKARFVNAYGAWSGIAQASFHVDIPQVLSTAPEVDCYSGSYDHATFITVKEQEGRTVYYTTDGKDPTEKSTKYVGPIPMPLGNTVMKFISYDAEHVPGEITEREYTLKIKSPVSVSDAVQRVVEYQIFQGRMLNPEGLAADFTGIYTYKMFYCIPVEDYGDFYLIYEYFQNLAGENNKTGDIYAVSLEEGTVYKAYYERAGTFMIEGLEPKEKR